MKPIGQLLVWISLAGGAVSAATAYLVTLDAADAQLVGLTLAAPAGRAEQPDGSSEPIAEGHTQLTADVLARLRAAGVRNLHVKQFDVGRWRGKWSFGLALAGLLVGGLMTRHAARPQPAHPSAERRHDTPEALFVALQHDIRDLRAELTTLPEESDRLDLIVGRVGQLQISRVAAVVEARAALVASHGLAGYAAVMDSFASAERQLNRAWSAAVDRHYDEAAASLERAEQRLAQKRGGSPFLRQGGQDG